MFFELMVNWSFLNKANIFEIHKNFFSFLDSLSI